MHLYCLYVFPPSIYANLCSKKAATFSENEVGHVCRIVFSCSVLACVCLRVKSPTPHPVRALEAGLSLLQSFVGNES